MAIRKLTASQLHRRLTKKQLPYPDSDAIAPLDSFIGQDRALKALELGLEIDASGYNIFVTGQSGTGRTTILKQLLARYAQKESVPDDWCYVFNFAEPDAPKAIPLPAGKGSDFRAAINQLIAALRTEINRAFTSEHYQHQRTGIVNQIKSEKRELLHELELTADRLSLKIQQTPMGFQAVAVRDGQPLEAEQYSNLTPDEKREINENVQKIETRIAETLQQLARLDVQAQKALKQLDRDVTDFIVRQYVNDVKEDYRNFPQVLEHLDELCADIVDNSGLFLEGGEDADGENGENGENGIPGTLPAQDRFKKYHVNVVVDNSRLKGAPVIHETNPTYNNIMGRIEKMMMAGAYVTDFTMIKAGSLLKANGGYLLADAIEVLRNPFVYDALKRSLRNKEARLEDVTELSGMVSIASLKPQPIPLKLKVILIGWNPIYRLLSAHDDDFTKIFKIRADFDYETDSTATSIRQYAQFVKGVIDNDGLPPFHRDAMEEIILYGHRLAGEQEKLSLQFGELVKIIQQAAFWATKGGESSVRGSHVRQAVNEYERRHSLVNDKMKEIIRREVVAINVTGERVGEINALSVYRLGEFAFGTPGRITAKTYIGNDALVSIERKAGLSGKIHNKGAEILIGFFNTTFGQSMPIAFSATLAFEQSYSRIDGDSASSTELYALLSSLSGIPIRQGIAVTGSVNQNGDVQAIGGVNEKIEGFFRVCREKGLTGDQGVMIPRSNEKDLLLKDEIREAVKAKQFSIWSVESIADGMEVLTGRPTGERGADGAFPEGSIYRLVVERLRRFAVDQALYRKGIDKEVEARLNGGKKKADGASKPSGKGSGSEKASGKGKKKSGRKGEGKKKKSAPPRTTGSATPDESAT